VNVRKLWEKLNKPREGRRGFTAWGCPGDGCDGIFRTPAQAADHGKIAWITGLHEAGPQRRARRARSQAERQLRGQARRAGRPR
jgi:hypothetical protein